MASDLKKIIWQKGAEGEQTVQEYLKERLDDTWVLLCGYKNRKGEIDQILVGCTGVFALEVKFINGDIYCDAKRWSRNKYDRYGNLVERNLPITDKNGRCPACQVNESADDLEIFLNQKMGYASAIKRAVILAHSSCRVKEIKNPTVDMITTLKEWDLRTFLKASSVTLNKKEVHHIVKLIGQDHAFHHSKQKHHKRKRMA